MEPAPPSTPPPPPSPSKTYKLTASSISFIKPPSITTSLFKHYFYSSSSSSSCTGTLSAPTYILKDVSLTAYPSEILAVVGPSGAGKSTLLDILAARTDPTSGSLHLNSTTSILQNPSSYRKLCAYVPQHDSSTLLSLLTVSETFAFSARLLLPTTPHAARLQLTSSLLNELGLAHLAHTRLVAQRGLSGGERRRVSIGLSLLHDPGVLILDEPTSGLDSGSAFNVMQTLKEIAGTRRRTVVVSVHQPSFKILGMVDRLVLLAKGRVVHHGSLDSLEEWLGFKGFEVPPQLNALEYAMEILGQLDHQDQDSTTDLPPARLSSVGELKTTDLCHDLDHEAAGDDDSIRSTTDNVDSHGHLDAQKTDISVRHRCSRLHEIITLHSRYWKIVYRTRQLLLTNALEALGVGLVLGTVYINIGYDKQSIQKRLGLFAFTLTFLLSSTTETLPIFIDERPVLLREASSGVYRLSSYLVANTLVFLPYLLAIALLYSLSIYFLVGLCHTWEAFAYFTLVIWIIVLMANSFVMLLSSIAPNYIAGTSLVTVLLAGFFLFSGYFVSKDSLPKYWLFMHFFSMYKYALDALLINEYSCLVSRCFVWYGESTGAGCMVTGRDVMEKRGLHERQRWTNVYALLGFFVMYRLLCLAVLMKRVSSRSNK